MASFSRCRQMAMMINLYSLILFAYVALRLIAPLPVSMPGKICTAILVLLISLKHFFIMHFFGGLTSPDLPRIAIIISGWLFVTLTFLFTLLVIRDLAGSLLWIAGKAGIGTHRPVTGLPLSLAIVVLAFSCSTYSLYGAIRNPDIKKMDVTLKRLPKSLDGLTIVQITDLHVNAFNPGHKVQEIVESVNALNPDLILFTGDMVDGSTIKRDADVLPLKNLRAKYGVFGSAGNHEYYSGYDAWQEKFSQLGIRMLNNSHTVLSVNGTTLVLAGITDPVAAQFHRPVPNVAEALKNAPVDAIRILMAHRPKDATIHATAGIDLQLSGHTHGGQIMGLNLIVARFNENLLMGWHDIGNMKLYISTGANLWNGFPARFGVPGEIPVITLRAE